MIGEYFYLPYSDTRTIRTPCGLISSDMEVYTVLGTLITPVKCYSEGGYSGADIGPYQHQERGFGAEDLAAVTRKHWRLHMLRGESRG